MKPTLEIKGHLSIRDQDGNTIFDKDNTIVSEGKGALMDWLASLGATPAYNVSPFSAIVLTKNASSVTVGDTFANSVFDGLDQISDEGVLHIPAWTAVTHVGGALTIELQGTLTQQYGNDPANNHINSVCVCMGTSPNTGGPAEPGYSETSDERLFSRVGVGDLIKSADKSYSFTWTFTIL